ncbi:hypothetical protein P7K49_029636 [Saguinus oedipus]|uniref:Uncharacterized protein n=1 Tax=Saguinus oedipus TaxID=9490 RepID=A0ABQ9U7R9_SAGOE|nr:hypothetical protein P7K49_029636 [Saguinus oedipus]
MPERDKDPRVQEKPDDQKGGPEGSRDAGSAFRPLRDSGGLSPSVARPGPLQRDLHTQRSEIPSDQTAQPSGISNRNAIASSYSSTGGFPWLKRRKRPASSHCRLPLTSSKTVSEVNPQAVSQGQAQHEKAADSAPGEKPAPRSGSPTSQASRPHRRKFPLLPHRRGEPLRLPSPLQLGFRVTAEDLELEKKAEIMWLNSFLQGEEKSLWECRASLLSHALSSLATGTSSLPAVPKASSTDAQQERRESQDGLDPIALQASAAGSPSRPPVSGRKCRSAGPLVSSLDTFPSTSAHSQDSAQASSFAPTRPDHGTPAHSASHTTTLARQRVSDFTLLQKLDAIATAITQPKPVVLHGQKRGTRTLKRVHPYSRSAASAAAQASSSAPTRPAQGTTAHSAAGASLPTTSTSSLAGTLSNPSSASHTTTLARQRVSDFTLLQKLDTIATAITQPKPVVLHGQQRGTRTLKRVHPYSHPAASAAAQASSSAPTRPDKGTASRSAAGVSLPTTSTSSLAGTISNPSSASLITALARLTISGPTSVLKLTVTAAATTQPKPVVLHGQQQGTHGLKQPHPSSHSAASAAAQASSSVPTQPAQGTTAQSAAGVSLPTTSTSSLVGTLSNPSSASLITALARLTISGPTSVLKLPVTTAATTLPKPVVLHGQQQGTHSLKQPHPSSHPAASAAAQASSSVPTQTAQGTTAQSVAGVSLPTTSTSSLAGTLSNPSSASLITALTRLTISGPTSVLKLPVTTAATTQPKPVVLHGQQQGTHGVKRARPYSDPAALALSPPTKKKLNWAAALAGTVFNPSSASLITSLARPRVNRRTSLRKLPVKAAATTQPKPVVLHGQQQGTRSLKWARPYSDPAALALSTPTKRKFNWAAALAGTLSNTSSACLITSLARTSVSHRTSLRKLAVMAAAITQPKPVVLHGQQRGTRTLRRVHRYSHPAASAAAQASSSAPRQPAQGTTAHSPAGVSLPTTSTSSLAGTLSSPSSSSPHDAHAASSDSTPAKVKRLR